MPVPCGKFLIGKCLLTSETCKYSHNKDDSPLCSSWIRANCSGRCPKRHYYLDKDTKETTPESNLRKGELSDQNEELVGVTVTKEVITHEVSTVDLVTGVTTTNTEETEYQVVDLTEVSSPTKQYDNADKFSVSSMNGKYFEHSDSESSSSLSSESSTDSDSDEGFDLIKIAVDNKGNAKRSVDWQALQLVISIVENQEEFDTLKEKIKSLPFKNESELQMSVSRLLI